MSDVAMRNGMMLTVVFWGVVLAVCPLRAETGGWYTHGGSATRRGYAPVELRFPLRAVWTHQPADRPAPAWPAPARGSYWQRLSRIEPRVVDDRTFSPVCVAGDVLYASSADDGLHCLDAETGEPRWQFTSDGPIRYAPFVVDGVAFFGSDDGCVYAVEIATGQLRWKSRLADEDVRIIGNGRMISAWPVRSGLVVNDGVVYATAGLFPAQGVTLSALSADDGRRLWRRPYDASFQGYLLAANDRLFAPTGRAQRVALSLDDGSVAGGFTGQSGSYGVVVDHLLVTGRGNNGFVSLSDLASRRLLGIVPARHVAADDERIYLLGRGKLAAIEVSSMRALTAELLASGETFAQRERRSDLWNELAAWTVETPDEDALAVCDNGVFVGGPGRLRAYDPQTGRLTWEGAVEGSPQAIAIGGNRVLAATEAGALVCFANGAAGNDERAQTTTSPGERPEREAGLEPLRSELIQRLAANWDEPAKGFCLVCGIVDGRLAAEIAERSELQVVAIDRDPARVERARRLARERQLYGKRLAVHHVDDDKLPFTDYFANVITSERAVYGDGDVPWSDGERQRVLRPHGGIQWLGGDVVRRGPLPGAGSWTHQYGDSANTANSGDRYVQRDVTLQWFGGPGPNRIVDRHLRSHAPLVSNGILIVTGENVLIGVDAYNGTERWHLELPRSHRYSIPYDAGYVAVHDDTLAAAVGDACWLIDIQDGQRSDVIRLRDLAADLADLQWSYTSFNGDQLIAGAQHARGRRTTPSRELIDADYRNETPVITSRHVLACKPRSRELQWLHSRGVVLNPSITVTGDRVFLVESRSESLLARGAAACRLEELVKDDAWLVALDRHTGKTAWERPLGEYLAACRNILYLQCAGDRLIACGSYRGDDNDTRYRVVVMDAANGEPAWQNEHHEGKKGAFTHGEQVHHPVVIGDLLIAEPVIYNLASGQRVAPSGIADDWRIVRPGHSCGTMSASERCLFFRANNPTMLDLRDSGSAEPYHKLAPTRPGCWINIIPAAGLVLIPEASASCVCDYPLQTSMAFLPRPIEEDR